MSTAVDDPRAKLRRLGVARPLIDGVWLDQTSLGQVDHTDPATGRVNGTISLCGTEEVEAAVAAAKRAYPAWRALSQDKRRRILQRIEELVEADLPEPGRRATAELGHPLSTATSLSYMCADLGQRDIRAAPFGGYNQNGYGREGGREGLHEFLRTKNVFIGS